MVLNLPVVQRFAQLNFKSLEENQLSLQKFVVPSQQIINTKNYDNEENLHHTTDAPRAHAHDGTGTGMARQLRRRDAASILLG